MRRHRLQRETAVCGDWRRDQRRRRRIPTDLPELSLPLTLLAPHLPLPAPIPRAVHYLNSAVPLLDLWGKFTAADARFAEVAAQLDGGGAWVLRLDLVSACSSSSAPPTTTSRGSRRWSGRWPDSGSGSERSAASSSTSSPPSSGSCRCPSRSFGRGLCTGFYSRISQCLKSSEIHPSIFFALSVYFNKLAQCMDAWYDEGVPVLRKVGLALAMQIDATEEGCVDTELFYLKGIKEPSKIRNQRRSGTMEGYELSKIPVRANTCVCRPLRSGRRLWSSATWRSTVNVAAAAPLGEGIRDPGCGAGLRDGNKISPAWLLRRRAALCQGLHHARIGGCASRRRP